MPGMHLCHSLRARLGPTPATLALAALLLPTFAGATTYYVAPGGNDANNGTSASTPFATISKANGRVTPGDVVLVANGTYSQYPAPGVSGTASQRITYIGDLANPAAVQVSGNYNLQKSYVTVKGFGLTSGIFVTGSVGDSVAWCQAGGDASRLQRSDDCVMAFCAFVGQRFWMLGSESDTSYISRGNTLSDCSFTLTPTDLGGHTIRLKTLDGCLVRRCRFLIDVGAGAVGASPTKLFTVRDCRFEDSFWDITNRCTGNCDESGWFVLRDFTQSNVLERDTIQMHGPGETQFFASCSGSWPGTTFNNDYDHCVIKNDGPNAYGHAMFWQDAAESDTVTNCVFASSLGGLGFTGRMNGPVVIDHCTIVGEKPWNGATFLDIRPEYVNGTLTFTNNIVVSGTDQSHQISSAALKGVQDGLRGHLDAHHNLYFGPMSKDSVIWAGQFTRPGSGSFWCNYVGGDCVGSFYADPLFENTTSVLDFDAHLRSGSPALGAALDGSDLGAFGQALPDAIAPAPVSDLRTTQVGDTFVSLKWTAPGDDGTLGKASGYDMRYSTSPITAGNFAAASAWSVPKPTAPGTSQTTLITGLQPGTSYYFAIRTRDEIPNWSLLGNVLVVPTDAVDRTPPSDVKDLTASP